MRDPARPDVPAELLALAQAADAAHRRQHSHRHGEWQRAHDDQVRRMIAALAPKIERDALHRAAEQLLATGSHDDRCSAGPPGACDCSLGEHYRWLTKRGEEGR